MIILNFFFLFFVFIVLFIFIIFNIISIFKFLIFKSSSFLFNYDIVLEYFFLISLYVLWMHFILTNFFFVIILCFIFIFWINSFLKLIFLFFIIVKYLLCLIFKTNNFILKRLYNITSFDLLIGFILIILIIFYLYMFFPVAVAQAPPNWDHIFYQIRTHIPMENPYFIAYMNRIDPTVFHISYMDRRVFTQFLLEGIHHRYFENENLNNSYINHKIDLYIKTHPEDKSLFEYLSGI